MSFFTNFPKINYNFGEEVSRNAIQDLSVYVDVIDQIRDNVNFYQKYTILEGERPDNLSYKFYGTPQYYWTFFLLNENIRQQGWPISSQQVLAKAQEDYPNTVLTTRDEIFDTFTVGSTVTGQTSGVTGTVIKRNLDLGQIFIDGVKNFTSSENLVSGDDVIQIVSNTREYNAVHHYENSDGEYVDIDPFNGAGVDDVPVTYYERYVAENDALKNIKVIKPSSIVRVVEAYTDALRQN